MFQFTHYLSDGAIETQFEADNIIDICDQLNHNNEPEFIVQWVIKIDSEWFNAAVDMTPARMTVSYEGIDDVHTYVLDRPNIYSTADPANAPTPEPCNCPYKAAQAYWDELTRRIEERLALVAAWEMQMEKAQELSHGMLRLPDAGDFEPIAVIREYQRRREEWNELRLLQVDIELTTKV